MSYGIKLVAIGGELYCGKRSGGEEWLMEFDFDAHDPRNTDAHPYPTGGGDSTPDPAKALRFDTHLEAWNFYNQPSRITPVRPDGKANRPLTVFTVSIEELPDAESAEGDE